MSRFGFSKKSNNLDRPSIAPPVSTGRFGFSKKIQEEDTSDTSLFEVEQYDSDAVGIDAWAQDSGRMTSLSNYMISRFGKEDGSKKEEETNKQYIQRFLTHARSFENNSVGLMGQIDYLRGADDNQRVEFGEVYDEYLKLPSFWQEGGDSAVRAVRDTVGQMLFDPLTLVGLGVGKVVTSTVGKVAAKEGLKRVGKKSVIKEGFKKGFDKKKMATLAGLGAVGTGAYEVGFDLGTQDIERKGFVGDKTPEDDIDLVQTAIAGGIGGVIGGITGGIGSLAIGKSAKQLAREGNRKAKKKPSLEDTQNEMLSKDADKAVDIGTGRALNNAEAESFISQYKAKKAKAQKEAGVKYTPEGTHKGTPFLEPQTLVELSQKMSKVVYNLAEENPEILTKYDKHVKISDIVQKELETIGNVDIDVLDRALAKEGMNTNDFLDFMEATDGFANMQRGSKADAGRQLQADSPLGKLRKKLMEISPEEETRLNQLFGKPEETTTAVGYMYNGLKRLDRERRALMTTQIATTARNVATGLSVITFDTLSNLIESTIYHTGKNFQDFVSGKVGFREGLTKGIYDVGRDSFNLLALFANQGKSKEMTEFLLQNNPRLAKILDRTLQEVGEGEGLSGISRFFNTLNIAQDRVFRRAFLAHDIDRKLRRAGVQDTAGNIYRKADGTVDTDQLKLLGLKENDVVRGIDYLFATDKGIDSKYLKGSIDYALKNTFAYMPKKGPAHHFIKLVESLPGVPVVGTGGLPFARFTANAMMFQFKYSPLNGIGAISNYGVRKFAGKKIDDKMNQQFREQISQSLVGTAALAGAIYYRAKNQDLKWYETVPFGEKRTLDMRPFFPFAPYLVVADAIVKVANGEQDKLTGREFLEGFTGAQFRAGAAAYTVDRFFQMLGEEGATSEKIGDTAGTFIGELAGGFLTPARVVKDIVAAFDEEEAIVRDVRQTEGETAFGRGFDIFLNTTLHKNLPTLFTGADLPELESPTREAPVRRQSPLLGQLLGIRLTERRTPAETELVRLGYENYEIFPSTGDKLTDSLVKKELGPLVQDSIGELVKLKSYKNLTEAQKQNMMAKKLERLREFAKDIAKFDANIKAIKEDKEFTPFERTQYMRLPRRTRKLAEEYFIDNYGQSVAESKKYSLAIEIGRKLADIYKN